MSGRSTKGNTSRCRLKIVVVVVYFTEFVGGYGFIVGWEGGGPMGVENTRKGYGNEDYLLVK